MDSRQRVERILPIRVVGATRERVVHGGLDARGAVARGDVANRVRRKRTLRVGTQVGAVLLAQALSQRHAVGGNDGAALHVGAPRDGVVVVG